MGCVQVGSGDDGGGSKSVQLFRLQLLLLTSGKKALKQGTVVVVEVVLLRQKGQTIVEKRTNKPECQKLNGQTNYESAIN